MLFSIGSIYDRSVVLILQEAHEILERPSTIKCIYVPVLIYSAEAQTITDSDV